MALSEAAIAEQDRIAASFAGHEIETLTDVKRLVCDLCRAVSELRTAVAALEADLAALDARVEVLEGPPE